MRQTSIFILGLVLAMVVKVHGMTLYSTFDTNSTEGNYFGSVYFSFSSTNSSDYAYVSDSGGDWWKTIYYSQTFTDAAAGVEITVDFAAFPEAPRELNIRGGFSINDPSMMIFYGGLGGSDETGGSFRVGQPKTASYVGGGTSEYASIIYNEGGTDYFGYSLTGDFDGTSGNFVGTWFDRYTVLPTAAPEPAVAWQIALGGICLWLARARHSQRCRN